MFGCCIKRAVCVEVHTYKTVPGPGRPPVVVKVIVKSVKLRCKHDVSANVSIITVRPSPCGGTRETYVPERKGNPETSRNPDPPPGT
jgi:hypothetical protein